MAHNDNPDDNQDVSSQDFSDLMADLAVPSTTSNTNRLTTSSGSRGTNVSSPRDSQAFYSGSGRPNLSAQRTSSNRPVHSQSTLDSGASGSQAGPSTAPPPPTVFNTPNRSIFSSGPPTASVSASTAHASMSSLPSAISPHPLSALTGTSIGKRPILPQPEIPSSSRKTRFAGVEKDVDDPSSGVDDTFHSRRSHNHTLTAVSSLFAAPEPTSPTISRHGSYIRTPSGTQYIKAMATDTAPLPQHLYSQGLLSGRHSDIVVVVFGTKYPLHRLLLDRAPFFRSAFSEPWHESSAKEITLHPEDIDSNITKTAFELALKRIYGCEKQEEEDKEALGLFATGCWLEMTELIESSVNSLLRQMNPANLATCIRLSTSNYYGKHGNRILAAAKAMLCREGWEMSLRYWDGISGEIIREIVGCDGFYVPAEWNRYVLSKRLLNRRLKAAAIEAGLIDVRGQPKIPLPESMKFMSIRFDAVYRRTFGSTSISQPESSDPWLAMYTIPDIAALLVLLDEGIHYIHLSFEDLQRIRETYDVLGVPLVPEKVISSALWMSMELRQYIVNARESDLELGIASEIDCDEDTMECTNQPEEFSLESEASVHAQGGQKDCDNEEEDDDEMDSGSWDGNGKPRKFWIPVSDATYPLGSDMEPVTPPPANIPSGHRARNSSLLDPSDLQWATDFTSSAQERPATPGAVGNAPGPETAFTLYPPFRFAVEFPAARTLKEGKRVYSTTVWYAGSLWNVYVQKKDTAKGLQLGIYLHRERQVDGSAELLATVNERISHIERENSLGRGGFRRGPVTDSVYSNDDSSSNGDTTLVNGPNQDLGTLSGGLISTSTGLTKASEASLTPSASRKFDGDVLRPEDEREDTRMMRRSINTLPPYVDARPTIKTYFKIYTPSKGGRVLSVYESAPDKFNFSQSWGWKSSNLILDDTLSEEGDSVRRDPRLRFMVVIGNV